MVSKTEGIVHYGNMGFLLVQRCGSCNPKHVAKSFDPFQTPTLQTHVSGSISDITRSEVVQDISIDNHEDQLLLIIAHLTAGLSQPTIAVIDIATKLLPRQDIIDFPKLSNRNLCRIRHQR